VATNRILLDSGPLTALAHDHEALRAVVRKALAADATIVVPTIVIAESTIGDQRDANVNRLLSNVDVLDLTERIARDAAKLRARVRGASVADAVVIATADRVPGTTVLTADTRDLRALAAVANRTTVIPTPSP
jgi:predicted nucleic acid-binding protein